MYDSIIELQNRLADLVYKKKAIADEKRRAVIDCKIRSLEKTIKILVLINNNQESFEKWANEQIDSQIATRAEIEDSVSIFLRRQAE